MPSDDAWRVVDEGWGRRAVDFATLSEPANCREYVALHSRLGVGPTDRVLDVACGAGLAVELAAARGAMCAGIDASPRLVAVAKERLPDADLRVGDMHALPWDDGTFDVVTSFRGIWGTTPDAVEEVRRVLVPGGRVGITVWGHIKKSPGAWALSPFTLASAPKVANQASMVALGRPGVGEDLLAESGFLDVERIDIPFAWEFADPAAYARAPKPSPEAQALYDDDLEELGFVMNVSKLWAHQPVELDALFDLMGKAIRPASLTFRQRGILVTACASALGDSYCSLAWGKKLATDAGADLAGSVLRGDDELLDESERALARWARQVARDPNRTTMSDVTVLRDAGFGDTEIFAITFFVALRLAFSTINDALGARPDRKLADITPDAVRDAVTFGRPVGRGET
jgi:SAM-dependent methyltransferase